MRWGGGFRRDEVETQDSERERHIRQLADALFFTVEKQGARFTLTRRVDVARPVRHENLTLEQAEEVLNRWKLRGPHGG
jgi:hypothetical protein